MIFKLQNYNAWPKPRPLEQPVMNHESAQPHPCRESTLRKMVMESFQQTLSQWTRSGHLDAGLSFLVSFAFPRTGRTCATSSKSLA